MESEHDLTKYGANEYFYNAALPYPDLRIARVIAQYKDLYKIAAEHGEIFAEIAGRFRHEVKNISEYPVTGDFVMISRDTTQGGNAIIHNILPRKTAFKRLAAGNTNQEQIIAANIDIVFICVSLNNNYNLNRIERYLSAAWNSGARLLVILTKSDLCNDLEHKITEVSSVALGADLITATNTDTAAYDKIIPYLKPGITASFIGSSGVGKSTLINLLAGKELFETQDIRHDGKGRHTTTRRELLLLPNGGIVIDTPGMREFGVESVDLSKTFSDIDELIMRCKFGNCTHVSEPGCAVQKAIASGELDKRRFENYQKLKKEALYDGLSAKQIETVKLEAMFKDIGGMKNMRKFVQEKMKNKYTSG
jgi:ribosome biogenesis GTPase